MRARASLAALLANKANYHVDVQVGAALALTKLEPPDDRAKIGLDVCLGCGPHLEDHIDPQRRAECAEAAGRVGEAMRETLLKTLRIDHDSNVRREAVRALGRVAANALNPDEVDAIAQAAPDDAPLVASLLSRGGSAAVNPLAGLLSDPNARPNAAESLRGLGPDGVEELTNRLAVDVDGSTGAVDRFLEGVDVSTLAAVGLIPPATLARSPDPVITTLGRVGADGVSLVAPRAFSPSTHLAAVRTLELMGEPALGELVLLLALQAQNNGVEWSDDEWEEIGEMLDRRMPPHDHPHEQIAAPDPAVIQALCWAGRVHREVPTRWLLRLLQRSQDVHVREPGGAWATIGLHIFWAGSISPPEDVTRELIRRLEGLESLPGIHVTMDRTFHDSWIGAAIRAAAAVCPGEASPALYAARDRLEKLNRESGLGNRSYRPWVEEVESALRPIGRVDRRALLRQAQWPWPVDADPA